MPIFAGITRSTLKYYRITTCCNKNATNIFLQILDNESKMWYNHLVGFEKRAEKLRGKQLFAYGW